MAEIEERHHFSYHEVVEALIKKQGLHEGLWAIYIEFGIGAANFKTDETSTDLVPTAIVPVKRVGLVRGTEDNNLTVDASVVNPRSKASKKSRHG